MTQTIRWQCFPDPQAVAGDAVQRILAAARQAIAERGAFKIVLAGGSTPLQVYEQLAKREADWTHWFVYLGDERCLPVDHPERNSRMITEAWLARGRIPAANMAWIPAELGARQGAADYAAVVRDAVPFDLVLLGMGEDGHTASLFPGQAHARETLVVPVSNAPKPPPDRISLNYPALASTRALIVIVTGAGKREAVRAWKQDVALPVAKLECAAGIDVLLDEAANG
jgi:6-phosphogluconolactonase